MVSRRASKCCRQTSRWLRRKTKRPPPKPSWCDVDWGSGLDVGRKGRAGYVCAGDTVFSPDNPVLAYGDKLFKNRFKCASKQKGVRCVNRKSGHGFFLSRQKARVF